MLREHLVANIACLRGFIDQSLALQREDQAVSGFELSEPLLDSVAYNAYIETVSNKTDTLYLRIKEALTEMTTYSYLSYIKGLSERFDWKNKEFVLAFDYTDEDFYGEPQGFDIHGWTGENGIKGKFKFLTCSIVSDDIAQKIPLVSIPVQLGHYKSYAITHCLAIIKEYIGTIKLILFDRGFYDKDLMYELIKLNYPFLIFVPKARDKKEILYPLDKDEHVSIVWDYELNKDRTTHRFETYLAFMKQIYDDKTKKEYDWVFATNIEEISLSNLIQTYKKRWRIETGFRVQDEARIKCKSDNMKIRYFLFMFQQMLQTQWVCYQKNEASFKEFVIEMHKECKSLTAHPKRSYGKNVKT